jgi:hypothetical protein
MIGSIDAGKNFGLVAKNSRLMRLLSTGPENAVGTGPICELMATLTAPMSLTNFPAGIAAAI